MKLNEQEITVLRREISGHTLLPFDNLGTNQNNNPNHLKMQVDNITENGWERWNHKLPSLQPPIPWHEKRGSFDYALHSWEPLKAFLHSHSLGGEDRDLTLPLQVAEDWLAQNFMAERALGVDDPDDDDKHIDAIIDGQQTACWYDMAVGQRIYRLAYILDAAARIRDVPDELIGWLYKALMFHHRLLAREPFFMEQNNHGIYQALGQLAAARRFSWLEDHRQYHELALGRVGRLFSRHFFDSGVHKEHSPGYHYMILGSFRGAAASGLFDDSPELTERLHKLEFVLGAMIQPDGGLTTIGDSDPRQLVLKSSIAARFDEETLQSILSNGALGKPPQPGVISYPDAGYAFARTYAPDVTPELKNASYLAQQAGFHSRTHKHADHLGFVWYDKNRDVLVDPGRYAYSGRTERGSDLFKQGFWYADPKRVYVEGTSAHNCVEIDGKSYPRAGAGGKPFGSALKYADQQNGLIITECEVTHFRFIRHWRGLVMAPGRFLIVLDWLYNRKPQSTHNYRQWFQFHPDWQVKKDGNTVRAVSKQTDTRAEQKLVATSLLRDPDLSDIIRGQEKPELQGWYSDKAYSLIPSSCFNHALNGVAMARFASIFAFGDKIEVNHELTRFNKTMRAGQLVWRDDFGSHKLAIAKGEDGNMQITGQ